MAYAKHAALIAPLAIAGIAFASNASAKDTETILYTFHNTGDGAVPSALIQDAKGALFGTTYSGHQAFELSKGKSGRFTTIATIAGFPPSRLVSDAAGNLYGTTGNGGSGGCGTVFKLSPAKGGGWTQTMIHIFNSTAGNGDGCNPNFFSDLRSEWQSLRHHHQRRRRHSVRHILLQRMRQRV